jgi:hypothetical protein
MGNEQREKMKPYKFVERLRVADIPLSVRAAPT